MHTNRSPPVDITPGAVEASVLCAVLQPVPIYCKKGFNFSALLQASCAHEPDELTGHPPDGATGLDANPTLFDSTLSATSFEENPDHPASTVDSSEGHRVGVQSRQNAQRRHKRAAEKATLGHVPKARTYQKYVGAASPIFTDCDSSQLRSQVGAYAAVASKFSTGDRAVWDLDRLEGEGIQVVPWSGRDPCAIVDTEGRVLVALAGQPHGASYQDAAAKAYDLLDGMRGTLFETTHRRGTFPVLNVGILHQQGTKCPVAMNHGRPDLVDVLLRDPSFNQLASFASASYQLWADKVFHHFKSRLDRLYDHLPLRRNFERSMYPAAAFNFGPNAWTFRHRDVLNSPYGWCAVQALGHFDATQGGHIVLWELGLAVEFPAGACILLPSATITHSNVPVQEGDRRASFTQYVPGGLLRYVDNGMRLQSEFAAQDPEGYAAMCEKKESCWQEGLGMLSRWDDVVKKWGA